MVLVGLLVNEFQIRGRRDDIVKRVIRVFCFWNNVIFALPSLIFVFYVLKLTLKSF